MNKYLLIAALFLSCLLTTVHAQTLEKLKEISTGYASSNPNSFTVVGTKLFFIAADDANQYKLYVSDGTDAGTKAILGAPAIVNYSISNLVAYKGKLFFTCNDGVTGPELWSSDGTEAGTRLFKDLYVGATGSYPRYFTLANGKLFFMGNNVDGERRLFVSDGTTAGTFAVYNNYMDIFNGINSFAILNNDIYFKSNDNDGPNLMKSNGTVAGTVRVKGHFIASNVPGNTAVLNNKLYFSGDDFTTGAELYVTDGTDAGTHLVKNLRSEVAGSGVFGNAGPYNMVVYNSKIYFAAMDDDHGNELFVTDGTAGGTKLVKDMLPGMDGSAPSQVTIYNGMLYYACWLTNQLWKSDGTEAGTQLVTTIPELTRFGATWNNKMYLISGTNQYLWQSDGTSAGTGPATVTNSTSPIMIYATDFYMTEFKSALYFGGYCFDISPSFEPLRFVSGTAAVHNFSFTGNGNWSNPANWAGGIMPPSTLMAGDTVVINGNCTLDVAVHAQSGSSITVASGKTLVIVGSLTII